MVLVRDASMLDAKEDFEYVGSLDDSADEGPWRSKVEHAQTWKRKAVTHNTIAEFL